MPVELGSAYGKIIIDASGVRTGTQAAEKSISSLQKGFSSASKLMVGSIGLITAEVAMLKKAFDFGEAGAAVTQTRESFHTLLAEIGAAPDLLEQLQAASKGTISDLDLMSSTALLLAGTSQELGRELAGNAPQIMEIAKAANKLNPSLGSVQFLYDSLMRGIKRGSPLIIDNTGLTLKLGEAYDALAQKLGKNADELTAEEQKLAILNSTLEAGDQLIAQVGGNTDAATDSFQRMKAAVKNATDEIKELAGKALEPAAEGLYWLLEYDNKVTEALERHGEQALATKKDYRAYLEEITRGLEVTGRMATMTRESILAGYEARLELERLEEEYGVAARQIRALTREEAEYIQTLIAKSEALDRTIAANGIKSEQDWEAALRLAGLDRATAAYAARLTGQARALEGVAGAQEEVLEVTVDLDSKMKDYSATLLFNKAAADLDADAQEFLARQLGLVDEASEAALLMLAGLKQQYDEGKISGYEYASQLGEINEAIASLQDKNVTVTVTTIQEEIRVLREIREELATPQGGGGITGHGGRSGEQRALGGPVVAGQIYEVGEQGREWFVAPANGAILPNDAVRRIEEGGRAGQPLDWIRLAQAIKEAMRQTQTPTRINLYSQGRSEVDLVHQAYLIADILAQR